MLSSLEFLYLWINVQLLPIATAIHAPLQGLKIIISLLFLYPLAFGYRKLYTCQFKLTESMRHAYMGMVGLILGWFCIGMDMKYCIFSSLVTFGLLNISALAYPTKHVKAIGYYLAIFNFVFNFLYLLLLYAWFETSEYDMDVTLVQSLLCLRNISIFIDFYDYGFGHNATSSTPLPFKTIPSFNSFIGYSYCYISFLAGPSITYSSYHSIISNGSEDRIFMKKTIKTFLLGMTYLLGYQVISNIFPSSFVLSPEYSSRGIIYKLAYLVLVGKIALSKYFGVWLLVEGSTYICGESCCVMQDNEPISKFQNIIPYVFETSFRFRHIVDSFNIKTNAFGKQYIFKRCSSFGKKWLSTLITISFLCIWHGFHFGYYHCFLAEFILLLIDDNIRSLPDTMRISQIMTAAPMPIKIFMLQSILYIFFVSFELMSFSNTLTLLKQVNFIPISVLLLALLVSYFLDVLARKTPKDHSS